MIIRGKMEYKSGWTPSFVARAGCVARIFPIDKNVLNVGAQYVPEGFRFGQDPVPSSARDRTDPEGKRDDVVSTGDNVRV